MRYKSASKEHNTRRHSRKKNTRVKATAVKIIAVIIIAVAGIAIYSAYLSNQSYQAKADLAFQLGYLNHNLNYTALILVIPQQRTAYNAIELNNISALSPAFQQYGYAAISVSSFNATKSQFNAIYPQIISSSIILTKNNTDANQTALLAAYQLANSSQRVLYQNNMSSAASYTYKNQSTRIYTTQSISALNSSFAGINISPPSPPLNQYVSTFAYGNLAVIVTVNGYSAMVSNISYALAEKVFQNLVQYKTAGSFGG